MSYTWSHLILSISLTGVEEEERRLTIDMEAELLRKIRKKEKKLKKREKRRRMQEERHKETIEIKLEESLNTSAHDNDYIEDISEAEDEPETDPIATEPSPGDNTAQYQTKSGDIRTVDLSQLGDLFPEYQQQQVNNPYVFAKKSNPTAAEDQQQLQHQQQQQHQHQQVIVPDPGAGCPNIISRYQISSITL